MKISTIRKHLVKQSLIVAVIMGVFGGIWWYIDSLDTEYDMNIISLKQQTDTIANQVVNLSKEYKEAADALAIYKEIKHKQDNKMLMVNKLALRDVIAKTWKYRLEDLDVKMDEIKPLPGDKYKRDTAFIEFSNTTINLKALSDLDIFELVKELKKSFLGIKFTSLKFSLIKDLDNASLIAIKDTGFTPLVEGKLSFILLGLRGINTDEGDLLTDTDSSLPQNPGNNNPQKRIRLRRP